jgi:hypothetical protein
MTLSPLLIVTLPERMMLVFITVMTGCTCGNTA